MKVGELIEKLKNFDPECLVAYEDSEFGISEVEDVYQDRELHEKVSTSVYDQDKWVRVGASHGGDRMNQDIPPPPKRNYYQEYTGKKPSEIPAPITSGSSALSIGTWGGYGMS